mmetsp:Transcript_45978/g.146826  ORF Transcript_45978/g.146826 Transcript_45978/m.146826 type:complete len:87 (-) Transcript_45978:328-588(-)
MASLGPAYMLGLYRRLWRAAGKMPTEARRDLVRARVRADYQEYRSEADPIRLEFLAALGESQLDNVIIQAEHLTECFNMPGMHSRV